MRSRGPDGRTLTPEAELTLLLVGARARRVRFNDRIAELATAVDGRAFATFLERQRLLALVGTRLAEIAPEAMPGAFAEHLHGAMAHARVRAMAFSAVTEHLTATLEARGIPALVLKGGVLAQALYGDPTLRAYDDIDVLVAPEHLDGAVAVARPIGWTEGGPQAPLGGALPQLHHHLQHRRGTLPVLELHWRIHWYETRFAAAMLARSRLAGSTRVPDPVDQLAALLLFYARDGFAGLRLAADVAAWWDLEGGPERLAALEALAGAHPSLAEPWRASLAVAARVTGLLDGAGPPGLRPRRRRSVLACRLANWDLRGDDGQIMANVTLVDGLLAPRSALPSVVGHHLLPPASFLERAYGVPSRAHGRAWAWRALHAARTLARYALALRLVRRERSWSPLPARTRQRSTSASVPPQTMSGTAGTR
jgi:putative nucleotidyltransferase-like protein